MKRLIATCLLALLAAAFAGAQTVPSYCTAAAPCWGLNLVNCASATSCDIAGTVATSPAGVETAGPATAAIYQCTVSGSQSCSTPASLPSAGWSLLAANNGQSLTQTGATGTFYAPAVYGSAAVFAYTLTYTGGLSNNQATSPVFSAQATFPAVPGAEPVVPVSISASPAT